MKQRPSLIFGAILLVLGIAVAPAAAQGLGEWGDAPEGALAYPASGAIGSFPTCQNVGPAGFVYHGPLCWAFFGPTCDLEMEGNAGMCPLFAPYDRDECFADGDAGLMFPPAYTIVPGPPPMFVSCDGTHGSLGKKCNVAQWGVNIDIMVTNNFPNQALAYVNFVADWNLSTAWGGAAPCPTAAAPEHALVNFPIPNGYSGPLSALNPPGFLIGPIPGFVWTRFTISERPVPQDWNGAGSFEDGETECYALFVDDDVSIEQKQWSNIKCLYR